ncbi:STAS domain-containing protein [Streptomyces cyaneofuscatus]|uniref:STAS domain-containing protein n=1 Tax=Streptomyces cyaneofuscatus TaxID=66883 RepID=UPI00331E0F77
MHSMGPIALVAEWTHSLGVGLEGDVNEAEDLELVELALESAQRSGKQVVIDLSGVQFMGAHLLGELLKPARLGKRLPWLAGPLSSYAERTLAVTGTAGAFRIFPTLMAAAAASRP